MWLFALYLYLVPRATGRHAAGRVVRVGRYLRKPRAGFDALAIVTRLWTERNAGKPSWALEPLPTRGNITRHNGR